MNSKMMSLSGESLQQTPLYNEHLKLGARIVPFAGYQMPVQYKGLIHEHHCVRKNAGLFDVSHMGIGECSGTDAEAFLNELLTKDLRKIQAGKAVYSLLCNEAGGTIDDLIVYRKGAHHF
jgi:aminomethyltransferase